MVKLVWFLQASIRFVVCFFFFLGGLPPSCCSWFGAGRPDLRFCSSANGNLTLGAEWVTFNLLGHYINLL